MKPSKRLAADAKGPKAARQLGTLGGGNHFLELLYDEEGGIWIMLHSGSRNIGATKPVLCCLIFCGTRKFLLARDSGHRDAAPAHFVTNWVCRCDNN